MTNFFYFDLKVSFSADIKFIHQKLFDSLTDQKAKMK